MAVLDSLPGVEVTVVVDGEGLHEYQDADMEDDEDTVTKYIEAVDGANFAVNIRVTKDATFEGSCLSFRIRVDGTWIQSPLLKRLTGQEQIRCERVDGLHVGSEHFRKLRFDSLETVTEHGFGLPKDLDRAKNLGKIEIRVLHENMIARTHTLYHKPESSNEDFISEKAIKGQAVTHSCRLDKEIYLRDDISTWDTELVTGTKDPAAIFEFLYRSKAALRDLMIIPRTPLPLPLEDRREEDLTPEEMVQLVRQLKAKVANTAAIKRESEDNNNNSRANKRARPPAPADPVHLELNDDDTFTEVAVAPREKTIISLDD